MREREDRKALPGSAAALQAAPEMPLTMQPEGVARMLRNPLWLCWGHTITRTVATREEPLALLIAEALDPRQPANTETLQGYLRFLRTELRLPDEEIISPSFTSPAAQRRANCRASAFCTRGDGPDGCPLAPRSSAPPARPRRRTGRTLHRQQTKVVGQNAVHHRAGVSGTP
ncbi:hypothetical protein ACIRL0_12290 [Streptomyces sp. NPDC102365]|uniref:hypothetical protein n=1 Tax=Streptomyces sp. NPDC102365 TaxID=3366162 RepID=UPI003827DA1A